MTWTPKELLDVIAAFLQRKAHSNKRLCFFIDGLDEYSGKDADLVKLVQTLSKSIKHCVSSRSWNVYSRAYNGRADGQLVLKELATRDIQKYAQESLLDDADFQKLQERDPAATRELLDENTLKAHGVFLWVYLVVHSLLNELTNDDDVGTLLDRVRDYPETLDAHYDRTLNRIERVYHKQSARLFLTALFVMEQEEILDLDSVRFHTPFCLELEIWRSDYAQLLHPPMLYGDRCRCDNSIEIKGISLHQWILDLLDYSCERSIRAAQVRFLP